MNVTVNTGDLIPVEVKEWLSLFHEDLLATNTENCENVFPVAMSGAIITGTTVSAVLPPASWNMIRLSLK